jgi:ribonuclease VapC
VRISVTVARAQLTEPARRAENGDEIVLTRHGHAAVRLVPVKAALDRESRRVILEAARAAGSAKAKAGPSAARSQDFLYGAPVIAIDTSALMAIVLGEPEAGACTAALEDEDEILISSGTLAEALIVSARRNVDAEVTSITDRLGFAIVTAAAARRVAEAYRQWGRGEHPAALNFGDCFAYEAAQAQGFRLLYISDDFATTDVQSVL